MVLFCTQEQAIKNNLFGEVRILAAAAAAAVGAPAAGDGRCVFKLIWGVYFNVLLIVRETHQKGLFLNPWDLFVFLLPIFGTKCCCFRRFSSLQSAKAFPFLISQKSLFIQSHKCGEA